jgi:16S rRNA (guanine(1405)-N(7))-methyltransferase
MKDSPAAEIASRLAESKKYRHLCPDTLSRMAGWAAQRHRSVREAEKAAKRKLHQIYAAYMTGREMKKIEKLVGELPPGGSPATVEDICLQILNCHASSRERIPHLAAFYRDIKGVTGEPGSVLDLSCGLNPFNLPWLSPSAESSYRCIDIDCRLIKCIERFFAHLTGDNSAVCSDILVSSPTETVDVVLLLKSLPCLEQQEPECSLGLLRSLNARHIVVSFPARSLSGRDRGMVGHYDQFMSALIPQLDADVSTLSYPTETVYIIEKKG